MTDRHHPGDEPGFGPTASREGETPRGTFAEVEAAIVRAAALQEWWRAVHAEDSYGEKFELSTTHSRGYEGFGFFSEADVAGGSLPVMGSVQTQIFDQPKAMGRSAAAQKRAAAWTSRQMREFVLRYFLRVSNFSQPEAFPGKNGQPPAPYLRPFSWFPDEEKTGFGFEQVAACRAGGDRPELFDEHERSAVVDLREIGTTYDWVVVKVDLFDFELVLAPLGEKYPHGALPATEPSYLVLSRPFIVDRETPGEDAIGHFGLGCAFLPGSGDGLLDHGLGNFDAGFQRVDFEVDKAGVVTSRVVLVAVRPRKAVNVDPVDWSFRMADRVSRGAASPVLEPMQKMWSRMPGTGGVDVVQAFITAANMMTSGGAARSLGLSKKQLHKNFLVAQFAQQYNLISSALAAWRQVPDWLETESLPTWATTGQG